jgi:hypothetical protein
VFFIAVVLEGILAAAGVIWSKPLKKSSIGGKQYLDYL